MAAVPDLGAMVAGVDHRDERIVVETERYRITGALRLPRDGYRSRLTDYLNSAERAYLPLTDVEIVPLEGERRSERRSFVALSIRHIVLAMPADGTQDEA
jgi:uncharacterized protein DUF6812